MKISTATILRAASISILFSMLSSVATNHERLLIESSVYIIGVQGKSNQRVGGVMAVDLTPMCVMVC